MPLMLVIILIIILRRSMNMVKEHEPSSIKAVHSNSFQICVRVSTIILNFTVEVVPCQLNGLKCYSF